MSYDAIIIPGGGLTTDGQPHAWVKNRLDYAINLYQARKLKPQGMFICLSRGTTHKSPPKDPLKLVDHDDSDKGLHFALDESAASARYLMQVGEIPKHRVVLDTWSLDTIGNAYFCRFMITDPMELRSCVIITSEFHMERTRLLFDWIFKQVEPDQRYRLEFQSVPNVGFEADVLALRITKEKQSVVALQSTIHKIGSDICKLSHFLFTEHGAYCAEIPTAAQPSVSASVVKQSY